VGGIVRRIIIVVSAFTLLESCGVEETDFELVASGYAESGAKYRALKAGFEAYRLRRAASARKHLGWAVNHGVLHPVVLYKLAVVTRITGGTRQAGALFRQAGRLFARRKLQHRYAAWSWIGAGNLAYRNKEYKKAEELYLKAYGIAPADPKVINRLAKVYFITRRYRPVIAFLLKGRRGEFKNDLLLSDAYLKLKRYHPVVSLLEPYYKGGDTAMPVLMNLGLACMGLAKQQEGKKDYQKAYRFALRGRGFFEQTVLRLKSRDEPFVKRLSPSRLSYFKIRNREYRDFSRREVIRYERKIKGLS